MLLEGLLGGGVVLIIVNLIVRDQTQFRLSRLRSELMALRSEEKRMSDHREEVELMVAQIGDALMRADRRRVALEKGANQLTENLEALYEEVTGENTGSPEAGSGTASPTGG